MDYKGYCLWASDVPAKEFLIMLLFLREGMMTTII